MSKKQGLCNFISFQRAHAPCLAMLKRPQLFMSQDICLLIGKDLKQFLSQEYAQEMQKNAICPVLCVALCNDHLLSSSIWICGPQISNRFPEKAAIWTEQYDWIWSMCKSLKLLNSGLQTLWAVLFDRLFSFFIACTRTQIHKMRSTGHTRSVHIRLRIGCQGSDRIVSVSCSSMYKGSRIIWCLSFRRDQPLGSLGSAAESLATAVVLSKSYAEFWNGRIVWLRHRL